MKAFQFWKTVTVDGANLLDQLLSLLYEEAVRYCAIGGQAVNAPRAAIAAVFERVTQKCTVAPRG